MPRGQSVTIVDRGPAPSRRRRGWNSRKMDESDNPFSMRKSTPMIHAGGQTVPQQVREKQATIFRLPDADFKPRVSLPTENPKYPETKHTVKCVLSETPCTPIVALAPPALIRVRVPFRHSQKGRAQHYGAPCDGAARDGELRPGAPRGQERARPPRADLPRAAPLSPPAELLM